MPVFESIIYFLITMAVVIIIYFYYSFLYWQRKNIPYLPASFPFGNVQALIRYQEHLGQTLSKIYFKFRQKGYKYGGFYIYSTPALIIIDPDLIKNILVKDFKHFDSRSFFSQQEDEPLSWNLFIITNPKWRQVRRKITPTFTSGKMKMMYNSFLKLSEELISVLDKKIIRSNSVNMNDMLYSFSVDIIGLCVFGLEIKALEGSNTEFYKYGTLFLQTTLCNNLLITLGLAYHNLLSKFPLRQVKPEVTKFFVDLISDIVKYREMNNIERNDFIGMYIKMKNNEELDKLDVLTFYEFASQAFAFFIAGFHTSAQTITFCLFELALNKELQEKLRDEIKLHLKKTNGILHYETVFEMQYLDMVVKETLRKYPVNDTIQRKCTERYRIPNSNLIIEEGTPVWVSVQGLHHDPEYYPNPELFDPERFRDDVIDKKKHPFSYIPFGEGPRICIGIRFAMLQIKTALINLLINFSFDMDPNTKLPLEYSSSGLLLSTKYPIYLRVAKIE